MGRALDDLRAELPALAAAVYLNTGGAGPLPRPAAAAIARAAEHALGHSRMSYASYLAAEAAHAALRARIAALLGAAPEEIALTTGVTYGLNQVIWGIDWRAGDEAVTTDLEHPGLAVPLATVARRRGVRLRIVPLARGDEDLEARVGAVVGPRTRLVALSHVAWTTGAVMDVAGAARAAARVGATVLVDGAQAAGAIPVAPRALGVHAYALPAQKWLLGPEGLGAVWIHPDHRGIDIAFGGVGSGVDHLPDGAMTPHRDARRWETGMLPEMLVPGWRASLAWLSSLPPDDDGRSGWDRVHNGTRAAARRVREALDAAGARVLTPPGPQAGLVAFTLPGLDPEPAAAALERAGVLLRWVPHPRALRVSAGVFTSADDVRALTRGLGDLTG